MRLGRPFRVAGGWQLSEWHWMETRPDKVLVWFLFVSACRKEYSATNGFHRRVGGIWSDFLFIINLNVSELERAS